MGCVVLPSAPRGVDTFLLKDWDFIKDIYVERFTTVSVISHLKYGHKGALKVYEKNEISNKRFKYIETEIKVHKKLTAIGGGGIVPLWLYYEDQKYYGLLMKYMNQGTLNTFIYKYHHEECSLKEIIYPLLVQIKKLHDNRIIHRDLKPDNIFVHDQHIYIGDFGYSYIVEDHGANSVIGTIQYMAPEILQCYIDANKTVEYCYEIDIWSYGIIVYELLFHRKPFGWSSYKCVSLDNPTQPEFIKKCLEAPLHFPHYISDDAKSFLILVLEKDPQKRATATQLLEHHWITSHLKNKIQDEICPIQLDWIRQIKNQNPSQKSMKKTKSKTQCIMS